MKVYIYKIQKIILTILLSLLGFYSSFAQVENTKIKDGTISNGAEKAKPGAIFELESNTKGMLVSRLTTAQRDAIATANLTDGLLIFNTTTGCFDYWNAIQSLWLSMCGTPPPAVMNISSSQCAAIVASGPYKQGDVLTQVNYLTVPVTVTQPGTYSISAITANGYYFEASGTFPSANSYTLILKSTGRPNNGYPVGDPGDVVTINLNGNVSSCAPNIYVEKANVDYSITCASAAPSGSYNIGLDLTTANKITLQVNVTNLGFWSMSTNTLNGYSFNGSGTFTTTGSQIVELIGTGKPITSGTNSFNISSNASTPASCSGIAVVVSPVAYAIDCASATQNGTYMQAVPFVESNTITLPVNVTATGQTTISTNTVNGISFSSGLVSLTTIGVQNIVLKGAGTPLTGGTTALTVTGTPGATATCTLNVAIATQPVAYTMTCAGITTAGTYTPTVPMIAANTMTVPVTVTYVGGYTINTNTVNGISFSGTGTFAATGTQNVVLTATGTPTTGGTFTYIISTNSASSSATCSKSILFVVRKMNVLGIGNNGSTPGITDGNYSARGILNSTSNYGPSGTVKMNGFNFIDGGYATGATLKNLINTNKIDIIFIGNSWTAYQTVTDIATLKDFVVNKHGVLIHSESSPAKINANNGIALIQSIYGSTYGTLADIERETAINAAAKIVSTSDPILDSPFKDVKGLNFAIFNWSSQPLYLKAIPGGVTPLITKTGDASRVVMFRDNTLGYMFVGDDAWMWGYVSYGNTYNTTWPMAENATGSPTEKTWSATNIITQNSFVYANIFAWAIGYAQTNTNVNYVIP